MIPARLPVPRLHLLQLIRLIKQYSPRPDEKPADYPNSGQNPRPVVLPSEDLAPIQPPVLSSKQVVPAHVVVPPSCSEEISLRCPQCVELDFVDEHLAYWSNVKRDLLRVLDDAEAAAGLRHGVACFHDLSLGAINQAMYQSVCQVIPPCPTVPVFLALKDTIFNSNFFLYILLSTTIPYLTIHYLLRVL